MLTAFAGLYSCRTGLQISREGSLLPPWHAASTNVATAGTNGGACTLIAIEGMHSFEVGFDFRKEDAMLPPEMHST